MKAIINGKLILPHQVLENHLILWEKEITAILPQTDINKEWEIYDAKGAYVAPGFINMHIHGIKGADTMDGTAEALTTMALALPKTGVTSFLPTTMTADGETLSSALRNIQQAQDCSLGATILGVNVEGPFLNAQYCGAQKPEYIKAADFALMAPYKNSIKIITVAPETLPSSKFIKQCTEAGIIVALGHSGATYEEATVALTAGASHITHLFNAMSPLHHRRPGLVGAALDSKAYVELICDNIHVAPMLQRLVYKQKTPDKIILITDSLRAALLGDGPSELGGQQVFVKDGKATLADGTIAGSVLTMNQALRNFQAATGAPLWEVVAMATLNPAVELGLADSIGSLEVGKRADIVLFDERFEVKQTFVKGEAVYNS